ncbi:ankyrin repeat-containing domain protein [Aspergillus insuetus]
MMRLAIEMDYPEILPTLLAHGLPFSRYAQEAVKHRSKKVLTLFLQHGWDINQAGETMPLVLAHAVEDEEMKLWLLNHGADPNKQCAINLKPLSWAVKRASLSTSNLLFKRGADTLKGELLHHAINRKAEVIKVLSLLLKKGAPLNGKQYKNHTNLF